MGAKYTATSVSGYNASPPADDGSTSESNKIKWSTIKTKLPDPLNTAIAAIDTKLTTWAAYGPTGIASATTLAAADNEKFSEVSSACTMTLTDASTLAAGWMHYIMNTSGGTVTVARATGGDTIDGTAANISLPTGEAIGVVVNEAGNGFVSFTRKGGTPSDNTVSTAKIVNDAVTEEKVAPGATLKLATMQASTSGTSIDFTSIPAGVKRITVMLAGVSTNGTSVPIIQIGDAGGVEASNYFGTTSYIPTATSPTTTTGGGTGAQLTATGGTAAVSGLVGTVTLTLIDAATFRWIISGVLANRDSAVVATHTLAYDKALSAELDRVRLTTVNGTDTFDAGSINIAYE